MHDTRYDAEKWLKDNVKREDVIFALSQPAYAPRIHMLDVRYQFISARPKNKEMIAKMKPIANYLVLTEKEFRMKSAFTPEFFEELLDGKHGYREVSRFSNKYLYPRKTIFGFAGWPRNRYNAISPEIIILKRE